MPLVSHNTPILVMSPFALAKRYRYRYNRYMNWKALTDYRCPKCNGHLRLIKARQVFVCEEDGFAVKKKKREEIARQYPIRIDPRIERHFEGIVIA